MKRGHRDGLVLAVLAVTLAALAVWMAKRLDVRESYLTFLSIHLGMSAIYLVAVHFVTVHCAWPTRTLLGFALAISVVLRIPFVLSQPTLSEDVYRYLWDGRLQTHGINPYGRAPAAEELEPLRNDAWENINHKEVPTIYPPLMQMVFAATLAMAESVLWMKTIFVSVDLLLILMLISLLKAQGHNPMRAMIYAWNPLVLVEIGGSGHNDVLMLVLLVTAHRALWHKRDKLSMFWLSLAGHAKLVTFALVPFFARSIRARAWLVLPVTTVALFLPYMGAGKEAFDGLIAYGVRWQSNDSLFHLMRLATGSLAASKLIAILAFVGLVVGLLRRRVCALRACYLSIGAILVLSPTVHPWYVVWIVPYLCFYPSPAWLTLTATVALAYHAPYLTPPGDPWIERYWVKLLEYAPFYVLLLYGWLSPARSQPRSNETHSVESPAAP